MPEKIHVLADRHIFRIDHAVPGTVSLTLFDPQKGVPGDLAEYDALLIRTVTSINEETLPTEPGRLRFVASATAGTDHVDQQALQHRKISFSYAPGCNARAVAEYVATTVLLWADRTDVDIRQHKVGIVGAGHTGTEVQALLKKLGVHSLSYDPPRAEQDTSFLSCSLEEVLQCDILTLHTPLTTEGRYPTESWLNRFTLHKNRFSLVLNASRGGVAHEMDLLEAQERGEVQDLALDVWEHEPLFRDVVARNAWFATPHIAGYSRQSKWRATRMIVSELCREFTLENSVEPFTSDTRRIEFPPGTEEKGLADILELIHPITEYDRLLRRAIGLNSSKKAARFAEIRTRFPLRDEYPALVCPAPILERYPALSALGIQAE
ncbi:MAG: 4-phosphoerythronate dehydrogenase [Balneolaceae bacterium]